ncbi:hypothetical protein DPMN_163350 [Dreissena polymorpha]|uniref:Uncharacterized protein n=1 Tax=Dreissena polymorpha TaxID=45954 RepID=A0A9D4EWG6_DREPO|nr:hypothetical protein DPMN_163350 [Dreissena polymorpha]
MMVMPAALNSHMHFSSWKVARALPSDVCIRSSMVIQNAAEIGESVERLAVDYDGFVLGCFGLEYIACPSVYEAQTS